MEKCIPDNLLLQYLVDELDDEASERVREHLNQCDSCQKRTEILSEEHELKQWQECHQRRQSDESSQDHPFSQERLDRLFNSTISSIQQSESLISRNIPLSKQIRPSNEDSSISIGKELKMEPIRTIGQYQLIKKIGQGGMGIVYLAIHSRLKKQVVLKLLLNKDWDNANQTQRFYREMELVGQLDHPNIVKATDAGEADDTCFLVMEYLVGHDLKAILKSEGSVSITAACSIIRQVANGLQYIHNNKLIHRDIKPSNLFLTLDGQVKILDLGLAGLSESDSSLNDLTDSNCIMGSAYYMAPEQAQSVKDIDQRSDIYSLGCTFYQLLTGQVPFRKDTPVETIIAHREELAPRLSDLLPETPEQLEELFQSMIQKDPVNRIQTMAEIVNKLDDFLARESDISLNEASDTYLSESQELKQLCCNADLTPAVEALNCYLSTQFQPSSRFFNKKTTILISAFVILALGAASAFLLPRFLPVTRPVASKNQNGNSVKRNELLQKQARSEKNAAIWALERGCEITISLPNGKRIPSIRQVESLPDDIFQVTQIKFNRPQHLTHKDMSHLRDLSTLQILLLDDCSLDDDALEPIKELDTLYKLDLHNTGLTDIGLSHISGLKNLANISLQKNPKLTDQGLQVLNLLQNLKSVNLTKLNISDQGLNFIQKNPKLEWLNISETQVTDESVQFLKTLNQMEKLFLRDTAITDAGMKEIRNTNKTRDPIKFD